MLRKYQPRVIGLAAAFAAVAMMVAVLGATSAQAANGPLWLVGPAPGKILLAGEKLKIRGESEGEVTLLSSLANILCESVLVLEPASEIIGGEPGTNLEEVEFVNCHLEGKTLTECAATSAEMTLGVVLVLLLTALAYPLLTGSETELNETEALDMVFPDGPEEEFTTFTLEGTNCELLANQKVTVLAKGTLVEFVKKEAFKAHCGEIGKLGHLESEKWVAVGPGVLLTDGVLEFPGPTDGWLLSSATEGGAATYGVTECKLEVDGALKASGLEDALALVEVLDALGNVVEAGWEK